jgi:hypothetical protein
MKYILRGIRDFVLWSYARNTWQWDVLCVLILVFIFLTPKSCFVNGERQHRSGHQTQAISTVILGPEVVDNGKDRDKIAERVRAITGRSNIDIVAVRPRVGNDGKTLAYEVDIR